MRIVGIDPGLNTTGYGIIDDGQKRFRLLEAGIIQTSAQKPIQERLKKIYLGVNELIKRFVCKENTTLVRKKKDRSAIAKDTVRADDRRAMVLIEETVNIFWLKKSE